VVIMPGYQTLSLRDHRTVSYDTGAAWLPLRADLGVGAFGLNAWRADRGQEVIERHDEADASGAGGHQEVYIVLEGAARFTVGGDEIAGPAGTVVFIEDPALERVAIAESDGTLVLAIGAERGVAFEPSEWESRELAARG
jgi:hypothetical protein